MRLSDLNLNFKEGIKQILRVAKTRDLSHDSCKERISAQLEVLIRYREMISDYTRKEDLSV